MRACQAIPLLCPRHRPAGNVLITEHWLDRCVQAEKGPHLLRDHRPVRLHILVAQDQEARSRECGTPRPQTRRVVIIVVVCCLRPPNVESASRAAGANLQGRAFVPMDKTVYRPRSTHRVAQHRDQFIRPRHPQYRAFDDARRPQIDRVPWRAVARDFVGRQ